MDYYLLGTPALFDIKSLVKVQTCTNVVKHLEKRVSTASEQQTGEGVLFEGTNENSSQPASVRPV